MSRSYKTTIIDHYVTCWSASYLERSWPLGPTEELPRDYRVLEFPPREQRRMWTYATCCMSESTDKRKLEMHLFTPGQDELYIELVTTVAHFHRTGTSLDVGHTVNFGRPWSAGSRCTHGLLSLPYLDGPTLEWLQLQNNDRIRFLWLIPITEGELAFKKEQGLGALETMFEQTGFNYLDPLRKSVVD